MGLFLRWCRMCILLLMVSLKLWGLGDRGLEAIRLTIVGLVTGVTGAAGNLGGIVYLLIARYNGTDYRRVFWIIGVVNIGLSLCVAWIRPRPKVPEEEKEKKSLSLAEKIRSKTSSARRTSTPL